MIYKSYINRKMIQFYTIISNYCIYPMVHFIETDETSTSTTASSKPLSILSSTLTDLSESPKLIIMKTTHSSVTLAWDDFRYV